MPPRLYHSDALFQAYFRAAQDWANVLTLAPAIAAENGDRRFQAPEWHEHPWYGALKQAYSANSRWLAAMVEAIDLGDTEKQKLRFFTGQLIDMMCPANFAATNPEAARQALESGGESLRAGLANLLSDLERGRIAITDEAAFEVGRNVAVSQGSVVFECELMQLIQYAPLTSHVASRPLVIVPPCVNKFYILDLQPANSFVRFACEQGYTVFLVSWRNPCLELKDTSWDDYLEQGVMQAIDVALEISGADQANTLGWCIGGTLLASALAVMRARSEAKVASMTLLTTLLDFEEPGDLGAFVSAPVVSHYEQAIGGGGILRGKDLGFVFQLLRANDLVWPYVVNNYLKGQQPEPFDLLYWNADTTNLPGPMFAWLLRNGYLENRLCEPDRLAVCGQMLDLGKVDMPSYILAAQSDHLVPWRSAYRATQLLGGDSQFVLGASGHIAGVINPPSAGKRNFWAGKKPGANADEWLSRAEAIPGSWWIHWSQWLRRHAGKKMPAPAGPGNDRHRPLERAPGRYVRVRHD
ncbi:class I poly(R)-hydroxyalkanoic acid synthase [Cupriavidus oxalaticus]|uniref:Class I poly(R)-hydroxyalkanoic acid synthase n=1 Tax=Cupriavidus oxalaticus TaxID=96344 RepID=A0A4P7LNX7_9BURK|nr:class I poly(R)-hydroxyalkanoic acid synthase [Cupriavidus oxalaticus]QBY55403.1 class I poly(R)-hydroxyalkanoic acid synthase [Cupriavidus oxalaticus]